MNEMKQAMREELKREQSWLLDEAREWLAEMFPCEDFDFFEDLDDEEVWAGIQRHYWYIDDTKRKGIAGGLDAFLLDVKTDWQECRTFVRRR